MRYDMFDRHWAQHNFYDSSFLLLKSYDAALTSYQCCPSNLTMDLLCGFELYLDLQCSLHGVRCELCWICNVACMVIVSNVSLQLGPTQPAYSIFSSVHIAHLTMSFVQ